MILSTRYTNSTQQRRHVVHVYYYAVFNFKTSVSL